MLALLLVFTIAATTAEDSAVGFCRKYIEPSKMKCVGTDTLSHAYFSGVTFVVLDTTCVEAFRPRDDYLPLRVAVDSAGNVFRIFNFDTLDYDRMLRAHPIGITEKNIYAYGRFYLEMVCLYINNTQYFWINDIGELKTTNRAYTKDWWELPEQFEKRAREIDNTIDSLSQNLDFKPVVVRDSGRVFLLTHFIWYQLSGKLREIHLRVDSDGHADVISDKVVADKVGYYEEVRWEN